MSQDQELHRRRFLRAAAAVTTTLACPWALRPARAATNGRALIGFQVPPTVLRLHETVLVALQARYEPSLGTTPVVHPGGSGMLAADVVGRSPRDGGTVMISPSSSMTLGRVLRSTPTDPSDALLPVAGIGEMLLGLIAGPAVPTEVRTVPDYIRWARAHPAMNRYGTPGFMTAPHFIGSQISRLADLPLHAVAYKGTAAMVDDVSAGNIPVGITVVPGADDIASYPKIRLLAVSGDRRATRLSEVPTLIESGLGESIPTESVGLFLPVGTPEAKVRELSAAIEAVVKLPAVQLAMANAGVTPMPPSVEPYGATIAAERARWQALVTSRGFTGTS